MRLFSFAAVILTLAAAGCGGGGSGAPPVSDSMEEATVSGKVLINGKAPTKAEITFDPANSSRKVLPRVAPIDADGSYTVKTLVGHNSVTVHGPKIDSDPILSTAGKDVDVKPGENEIPIELP